MAENSDIRVAVAALSIAQADYASLRAGAAELLASAQLKREEAMRLVAALGVSHRQIGELTDLSHTRVNQILGTGRQRIPEAHLPPAALAYSVGFDAADIERVGEVATWRGAPGPSGSAPSQRGGASETRRRHDAP